MIRSALGAPALHSRPLATASTEACFYEVLEVSKTATAMELKTAFRQVRRAAKAGGAGGVAARRLARTLL